jgi:hypothetical protein
VESILKNKVDGKELPERPAGASFTHGNIRGNNYYK